MTLQQPSFRGITPRASAFDATNWYWVVGNRPGVVYGSSAMAYVDANTDQGYQDFLAAGNVASNILTDGELASALTVRGLTGPVVWNTTPTNWGAVALLDIIAAVSAAGCKLTSTGTPALNAHYQLAGEPWTTMNYNQTFINSSSPKQLPGNVPLPWAAYDVLVTFQTATDHTTVFSGLNDYLQAWKTWAYHGGTMPAWGTRAAATLAEPSGVEEQLAALTERVAALEAAGRK